MRMPEFKNGLILITFTLTNIFCIQIVLFKTSFYFLST